MKTLKKFAILILSILILFSISNCVVFVKKDNGKHKGWNKSQNKQNNQIHRNNPEKSKGKHKK